MKYSFKVISWNMKYFYFSIQHSLHMFLIKKKIVFTEKRYRVKLIEKMLCKKFKNAKTHMNDTMFENQERQKYIC